MPNRKIRSSKSEAIYDILVKSLGVTDDYYERETFVYHHSVCNHNFNEYTLKLRDYSGCIDWIFKINDNEMIQFNPLIEPNEDIELEARATQIKVNRLIQYVLNN